MNAYHIVSLKYDEAKPVIDLIKENKIKAAIDYMVQWDFGRENENSMSFTKGFTTGVLDESYKKGKYTLVSSKYEDIVSLYRTTRRNSP